MKQKIALFFPFALEAQTLLQSFPFIKKGNFWEYQNENLHFGVFVSGQGKVATALNTSFWVRKFNPHYALCLGSAGALQEKVPAKALVQEAIDIDFKDIHSGQPRFKAEGAFYEKLRMEFALSEVKCVCADRSINTASEREHLAKEFQAQYASWESAAFLQSMRFLQVESAEIRFVVDFDEVRNLKEFKKALLESAAWMPDWFRALQKVF